MMPFTKNLDILPHSGTVVIALQNRESPTLMSLKLLERRIKLVFPSGIGHMLSGAATFALMQEERDCKFSLVTSLPKREMLRLTQPCVVVVFFFYSVVFFFLSLFLLCGKHLALCKSNRKPP